jgi:hypothetical protein
LGAEKDTMVAHLFPFCCFQGWLLRREFVPLCKMGVFQYVLLKVLLTSVTFVLVLTDTWGDGQLTNLRMGYVYITVITNLSQLVRIE